MGIATDRDARQGDEGKRHRFLFGKTKGISFLESVGELEREVTGEWQQGTE